MGLLIKKLMGGPATDSIAFRKNCLLKLQHVVLFDRYCECSTGKSVYQCRCIDQYGVPAIFICLSPQTEQAAARGVAAIHVHAGIQHRLQKDVSVECG